MFQMFPFMGTENLYFSRREKTSCELDMLIGAISDTHDNLPQIEKAVQILNEQKVGLVLHAGDYVAGFVIPQLAKLKLPTHRRIRQQRRRPRTAKKTI